MVAQQLLGKNRGEMFVDQALPVQVAVEQAVKVAVRRFLADKAQGFGSVVLLQFSRQGLEPVAHRVHENCSPTGKLIDSVLKKAVRNASPAHRWRGKGVSRLISRRRRTSSPMVFLQTPLCAKPRPSPEEARPMKKARRTGLSGSGRCAYFAAGTGVGVAAAPGAWVGADAGTPSAVTVMAGAAGALIAAGAATGALGAALALPP